MMHVLRIFYKTHFYPEESDIIVQRALNKWIHYFICPSKTEFSFQFLFYKRKKEREIKKGGEE